MPCASHGILQYASAATRRRHEDGGMRVHAQHDYMLHVHVTCTCTCTCTCTSLGMGAVSIVWRWAHEILDSARETDRRYVELTRKEAREEARTKRDDRRERIHPTPRPTVPLPCAFDVGHMRVPFCLPPPIPPPSACTVAPPTGICRWMVDARWHRAHALNGHCGIGDGARSRTVLRLCTKHNC